MTRATIPDTVITTLEVLEEYNPNAHVNRTESYKTLQGILDREEITNGEILQRLLTVCIHDMSTTMYSACVLNMVSTIVSKIKMGTYDPEPDLLPSALAILNLTKKIALFNKVESLMILCYRLLLSYPDHTLLAVADNHEEVMEALKSYCHIRMPISPRMETYDFLYKLLQILPHEKKRLFIEKGITIWFSKIIPMVIYDLKAPNAESQKTMAMLELITDDLVNIDYTKNPHWHSILECICDTKQYPAIMKDLLHAENDAWYRLWIIFICLLKHQVTQSLNGIGSPINSMLPVVEMAFKLDAKSRCNAFECWIALIDSFSIHSIESKIAKTMNLLLIPLKSNNAKTPEVVLAKFKCWWHLLRKFQNKMDKFHSRVVDSFIKSYFGKNDGSDNAEMVPGLYTDDIKKLYNQSVVDMVGHIDCEGCTELPQLNGKIINTQNLVDNWKQWIFTLVSVFKTLNSDYGLTKQQSTCLWKSFAMTIAELPENNIRKDLFNGLISKVPEIIQNCNCNTQALDIVFHSLLSLFDEDTDIRWLFKSDNSIIIRFIKLTLDESLQIYYKSVDTRELVTKLKAVTNVIFDEDVCKPDRVIDELLLVLPPSDVGLIVWTALTESLCKSNNNMKYCQIITHKMLLWPLKSMHKFYEVKIAALAWYTTYNLMYPKLNKYDIDNEILAPLYVSVEDTPSALYFKLYVILSILKNKITKQDINMSCKNDLNLLLNVTKLMNKYEDFRDIWQVAVEIIALIVTTVTKEENEIVAPLILISLKNVLNMLTQAYKKRVDVPRVLDLITNLLEPLDKMFAVNSYSHLLPNMSCHLLKCFAPLSAHLPTQTARLSILKKILEISDITDVNYNKVKSLIDILEKSSIKEENKNDQKCEENKLPAPQTLKVPKRTKTKQANIVNTVVENGEEYVVVKSNWKFNPKKLTENQKEKLQRKREDIPALYQDLSQSQDEFKLAPWKTDSQDNTSSSRSESKSSKPGSNETASEIIKNLSSPNVVPRILENIISENNLNSTNDALLKTTNNVSETSVTTHKANKTPRMALKDRVFRNMRNLIENSGIHKENEAGLENPHGLDNATKLANAKHNKLDNVVNSAPPLLSADRPSRMKRKPRKFDDLFLLSSRRNRSSLHEMPSDNVEIQNRRRNSCDIKTTAEDNEALDHNYDIFISEQIPETDSTCNKIIINNEMQCNMEVDIEESLNTSRNDSVNKKDVNTKNIIIKATETVATQPISQFNESLTVDALKNSDECADPTASKEFVKEISIVSTDLVHVSTPKSSKNNREISTSGTPREAKVILTPRTPKVANKDELASNASDIDNELLNANTPKGLVKEVSTSLISKPVKEPFTSKTPEAINEVSSPGVSKYVSTPKTSKHVKNLSPVVAIALTEKLTPSKNYKGSIPTSVPIKDVKESSATKTSTVQDDATAKLNINHGTEVLTTKQIEENCAPVASIDTNVTGTPNQNITVVSTLNTPTVNNETSNSNQCNDSSVSPCNQSLQNKSTEKKFKPRKPRIEKELAIDMVEGHPLLKLQSEKRLTRKALKTVSIGRRKSTGNLHIPSSDSSDINNPKTASVKKTKGRIKEMISQSSDTNIKDNKIKVIELLEQSSISDELPCSEDVIESSQDSTITTISVKSSKTIPKKVPIVYVEKIISLESKMPVISNSPSILEPLNAEEHESLCTIQEGTDDIVLPLNKTVLEESSQTVSVLNEKEHHNLTADMDTEPFDDKTSSEDIILISDDVPAMEVAEEYIVGADTQEITNADTQSTNPSQIIEIDTTQIIDDNSEVFIVNARCESEKCNSKNENLGTTVKLVDINNITADTTNMLDSSNTDLEKSNIASSPFKDEVQRQQDFLNNTVEISPIKTMSPNRDKTSTSPETSNDYVVITLTSPVHSNGEPFEKCGSPEVFTEDKVSSPDKRDQSPPRAEVNLTSTSPSSSLSLKKNKPQVRSGGRAAQMLGLCVPDNEQTILNTEKEEPEEIKKCSMNTHAKRNLRILYNSVNDNGDSSNNIGESDDSGNFLKFRRSLPAVDSSPSGSILKRKLAEIADESMISPASKRKRVSFHDPPVSTTISVQKYIEPGLRSPQGSMQKRQESRQLRQRTSMKSPKKLENVFKLDTVLTNTVESFSKNESSVSDEPLSLDETPVLEIIRPSELNDTDPICLELIDCQDSIENIVSELSSPSMKLLLFKELEGKIETVGDLAKLTEFEVNRLCIKAPKIKVAKQVLLDYATKRTEKIVQNDIMDTESNECVTEPMIVDKCQNVEVQTDSTLSMDIASQTVEISKSISSSQTEKVTITHASIQTNESGEKSTADIIQSCLSERPDFVEKLGENLEESAIKQIIEKSSSSSVTDLLLTKLRPSDVSRIFENICHSSNDSSKELSFISDYLCDSKKFAPKDLILFCSGLLKAAHSKLSKPSVP